VLHWKERLVYPVKQYTSTKGLGWYDGPLKIHIPGFLSKAPKTHVPDMLTLGSHAAGTDSSMMPLFKWLK